MKVLFDTNVVLDVLLDRKPFNEAALKLFANIEEGKITGLLGATTITTTFYLTTKVFNQSHAHNLIKDLVLIFEIAPINRIIIEESLENTFNDFEDSISHSAAIHSGAQAIVTRNLSDFQKATIAVYSPDELIKILSSMD